MSQTMIVSRFFSLVGIKRRLLFASYFDVWVTFQPLNSKAEIPREQFPRHIPVANVTRLSLTCHAGLSDVSDEDAIRGW